MESTGFVGVSKKGHKFYRYVLLTIIILILLVIRVSEPLGILTGQALNIDYTISYPILSNAKLTRAIKEDALQFTNKFLGDELSRKGGLDFRYTNIYETDNIISVSFEGLYYLENTAHPTNLFYTITIDNACRKMILADYVKIDDDFVAVLLQEAYAQHSLEFYSQIYDWVLEHDETIIALFNKCDQEGSYLYSYLTHDSVGISIPVHHAYGDYIVTEIPLEKVSLLIDIKRDLKLVKIFS